MSKKQPTISLAAAAASTSSSIKPPLNDNGDGEHPNLIATKKKKGVKNLVSKYENKQNTTAASASVSSVSSFSDETLPFSNTNNNTPNVGANSYVVNKEFEGLGVGGRVSKLFYDKNEIFSCGEGGENGALFTSTSDTMPLLSSSCNNSSSFPCTTNSFTTTNTTTRTPTNISNTKIINEQKVEEDENVIDSAAVAAAAKSAIKKMIKHYENSPNANTTTINTTSSSIRTHPSTNGGSVNSHVGNYEEEEEEENSSLGTVSTLEDKNNTYSKQPSQYRQSYDGVKSRRSSSLASGLRKLEETNEVKSPSSTVALRQLQPAQHIFRNPNSNLTAVLYLANQQDQSKFKVFLKGTEYFHSFSAQN